MKLILDDKFLTKEARQNTFLESPNAETGLSGLGKIPVVQGKTEIDAREEIPDYRKNCSFKGQLVELTAMSSHYNTQCIVNVAVLYSNDLDCIFLF